MTNQYNIDHSPAVYILTTEDFVENGTIVYIGENLNEAFNWMTIYRRDLGIQTFFAIDSASHYQEDE